MIPPFRSSLVNTAGLILPELCPVSPMSDHPCYLGARDVKPVQNLIVVPSRRENLVHGFLREWPASHVVLVTDFSLALERVFRVVWVQLDQLGDSRDPPSVVLFWPDHNNLYHGLACERSLQDLLKPFIHLVIPREFHLILAISR